MQSALDELADMEYQLRVWTGMGKGNEISSFTECMERLFDDSGLGDALRTDRVVFGAPVDEELKALCKAMVTVDEFGDPAELIASPQMRLIRERASSIAGAIDRRGLGPAE